MAKLLKDGTLIGRVGNMIYYQVHGETYVKSYSKPSNPNTFKQQVQRKKIQVVHKFLSKFRQVLAIGYQNADPKISYYNEAASYHLRNAVTNISVESVGVEMNLQKVRFSRGLILSPEIYTCNRIENQIILQWNPKLISDYNRHSDKLALVGFTPGQPPVIDYNAGFRMEGSGILVLPENYNDSIHLWAFYHNSHSSYKIGKDNVSDCVYLGEF